MPKYKIDPIPGLPTWFTPGIVCRVRDNSDVDWQQPRPIDCFNGPRSGMCHPFKDRNGRNWPFAEPVEQWEPQEGEWVAGWDDNDRSNAGYRVLRFGTGIHFDHHARLVYPDGSVINCARSVEELKGRTDWI